MNDTPFTTIGDEPVEARIVAWVLGETSSFEAAELERLCEERPELLIFRRRMLALHGLLAEAETARPEEGWKLPPEKRKELDEIFGEEQPVRLEVAKENRIRRSMRRALLAIAACFVMTLVVLSLMPGKYEAAATIEVKPRAGMAPVGTAMAESSGRATATPQFFATEFEKIKSRSSLEQVVDNLDLDTRWGTDKETALRRLKDNVSTQQIRGTDLIEIRAREKDPALAKSITNEVARSYKAYRNELEQRGAEKQLAELNKAVRDQEDKVEERRKVLATIVRTKGIIYKGQDSFYGDAQAANDHPRDEAIKRGLDAQDYVDAKREFETDQELLQQMKLKQIGETIAKRIPGESVQIHEEATTATPANPLRAAAYKLKGVFSDKGTAVAAAAPAAQSASGLAGQALAANDADVSGRTPRSSTTSAPLVWSDPSAPVPAEAPVSGGEVASADTMDQLARNDSDPFAAASPEPSRLSARKPVGQGAGSGSGSGGGIAPKKQIAGKKMEGSVRSNPALTHEHSQTVDQVRRNLYMAEGNYNLGKYDDAKREYEAALRTDPYNAAARRGLERIASEKTDHYRAAYDHTRAELLAQVDNAWELSVPADGEKGVKESDGIANNGSPIEGKPAEGLKTDPFWDTSNATKPSGGVEYEIHTGYSSEYLFRGRDLSDKTKEPPKPDLAKLMEEISATEDPYSTFSLNISDASFQIAQAALAKGEQPDPAGIKVEQFYNAVDYGDPAPSAGEPVAVAIEQSAHPVIPGRNLVRVALKTAAAGRSASQPLRLTLLVDQSGSMVREDRRAAMEKALAGLAGLLTEKDSVSVVGFSRTPRLLADSMPGNQANKLAELVNQSASEGGTNLEEAIQLAEQMADRNQLAGAQNRIVLFTDGAANLGNADPVRLAEKVKVLRQKGIAFDIAGIAADGLNDELLGELARNGNGRYYVVGKGADDNFAKQLAGAFRPAAENVKVQVHFNPERVGRYKLIGFEKDRLKTEDFRNDAVDAAELAAEEAGVAIYQVEPLPGGNGELGEVSVRFRDAASAQMVERTWTIPHDNGAPAIDRATPSMQLAVLSMLAAEKLKGGPLAEAIDFQQLADPRANVKRFYGNTGRVGEMLRMLDALK